MPTFTMTKTYDDSAILYEADLDGMKESTETFLNVTKLDSDNIQDGGIDTDALATSSVTTAKVANGAITQAKRAALGHQISSSSGSFFHTSTALTDVTNLSVSITTTGRPVYLGLISDGSGQLSFINIQGGAADTDGYIVILRDSTEVARYQFRQIGATTTTPTLALYLPPGSVQHIDVPSAATYTYKVQVKVANGTNSEQISVYSCKLVAFEL